jgi:predicted HTH domain antitoxin
MKMKNLMQFEVKTYQGNHNNVLAQSVINFLNKEHHSVSLNKKVKYADMELTQFINTIAKDLEARDLLKEAS